MLSLTAIGCCSIWLDGPASASTQLLNLESSLQSCIQAATAKACRQAESTVLALSQNPSYAASSHLCKEEISELSEVVKLLPMQDVVPTEVMASVADVQQACIPYGF